MAFRLCLVAQALCINDSVLRLGNAARINEKCLDLQQSKPRQRNKAGSQATSPAVRAHLTPACLVLLRQAHILIGLALLIVTAMHSKCEQVYNHL